MSVQVDLGRSEDYGLYYFNVKATGENEVEVVVVEDEQLVSCTVALTSMMIQAHIGAGGLGSVRGL
jgi:hypothetical protein